jgi:hypothetical protein
MFTNKQKLERENLEWFAPANNFGEPTDDAFKEYLDHSERGVAIKSDVNYYKEAKRMRGITIHELWENSFYADDGSWLGFYWLLREEDGTKIKRHIAEFISREIFAGQSKELVMSVYNEEE